MQSSFSHVLSRIPCAELRAALKSVSELVIKHKEEHTLAWHVQVRSYLSVSAPGRATPVGGLLPSGSAP
jgi:hypothetical protein